MGFAISAMDPRGGDANATVAKKKPMSEFSEYRKSKQAHTHNASACCNACLEKTASKQINNWTCTLCHMQKADNDFGEFRKMTQADTNSSKAPCDACANKPRKEQAGDGVLWRCIGIDCQIDQPIAQFSM